MRARGVRARARSGRGGPARAEGRPRVHAGEEADDARGLVPEEIVRDKNKTRDPTGKGPGPGGYTGGGGGGAGGFRESHTPTVSGPYTASPLSNACAAVTLTVHVLNQDYDKQAYDVRVGFYDYPENGTETLIGYTIIDNIVNAKKRGEEIIAGTS